MHLFEYIFKGTPRLLQFMTVSTFLVLSLITVELIAQPNAQKGVINLQDYNFDTEEAIPLGGEWEFYWNKFLTGSEFQNEQPDMNEFLTTWDKKYSSFGFATYRLRIQLPKNSSNLALQVPLFYSSYTLLANGTVIAENGKVGTTKEQYVPKWIPQNVSLHIPDTSSLELVLHVANFNHKRGGAFNPIYIGDSHVITKQREAELAFTYLLTGILIITGFFFLGLYLFGKQEKAILFFALFCIAYSYRIIGVGVYPLHFLFPDIPWLLTLKLEYITLFLSGLFFGIYTLYLYPKETSKLLVNILSGLSSFFIVLVIILPTYWFTQLVVPYFIILISYIVYAFWVYIRAYISKREGAGFALASTGIVFIVFLYQMMDYFGILENANIYNFLGYLFFFSLQSLVLTYRFSNSLKRATKKAEAASIAKSQFLSTMSHEIRTPLNAVIGLSGLLAETSLDPIQKDYVRTVKISGENLLSIINNILDYSKIESNKIELQVGEIAVQELIENVLDLVAPLNINNSVELIYDIDDSVSPFIITDHVKLQQILINLINNAIKFTEEGEVFVQIKMEKKPSTKSHKLLVSIKDTGIGISADGIKKLFQSFSQVDGRTNRKHGGTGLGLVICKRLIEALGGGINVSSEIGKGTDFSFFIEVRKSDKKITSYKSDILNGKKALVLDDNTTNLKIFEQQGIPHGLKIKTITDSNFISENISTLNEFDFIVLDMQMPLKNGIEVAKEIRAKWPKKSLPLVMLSSIYAIENKEDLLLFNLNLTKPVKQSQLFRNLERLFSNSGDLGSDSLISIEKKSKAPKAKILIAEDNLFNQKVSIKILERFGYNPTIVPDGKAAFDAILNQGYDIVFMDVEMPIMDGIEATKKLRSEEHRLKNRPIIIAMTANALLDDKERCLNAGMDDFITKPVTIDMIQKILEKWV